MLVSVLTPSIPERARMLEECRRSVAAQTEPEIEHLVHVDEERRGCAWTMNHLAGQATGDWLLPLADDDLLLPAAVETLLAHSDDADVVFSPPLVTGTDDRHFFGRPPFIPSCALIWADLWRELGGYTPGLIREEDRDLWVRALELDAVFVRVDSPQWVYRIHSGSKSYHQGVAA